MSRNILINKIFYLEEKIKTEGSSLKDHKELRHIVRRANHLLRNLECVPTSWATEDESIDRAPDAPNC